MFALHGAGRLPDISVSPEKNNLGHIQYLNQVPQIKVQVVTFSRIYSISNLRLSPFSQGRAESGPKVGISSKKT